MENETQFTKSEVKALVYDMRQRVDDSRESRHYPWDDVFASMLVYHNKVRWSEKKCAACMNPLIELYGLGG